MLGRDYSNNLYGVVHISGLIVIDSRHSSSLWMTTRPISFWMTRGRIWNYHCRVNIHNMHLPGEQFWTAIELVHIRVANLWPMYEMETYFAEWPMGLMLIIGASFEVPHKNVYTSRDENSRLRRLKSILGSKNFQTWLSIGWQHNFQPIRSNIWKLL